MFVSKGAQFLRYAAVLLVLGLAQVLYRAEVGQVGWNPKALTALIAAGIIALLVGGCGVLARRLKSRRAIYVGLLIMFMAVISCTMKARALWSKAAGDGSKLYPAVVTTLMAGWSVIGLIRGGTGLGFAQIDDEG
jgi:hypothetical protein